MLEENNLQASNVKPDQALDIEWLDFAYKSSVDEESLSNDACYVYDTLCELVDRMHTTEAPPVISINNGKVAIIDFSNASVGDLQFLMQLFTGCSLDEAKQYSFENMLQSLSAYIPLASIQVPKPPQGNMKICFSCNTRSVFGMQRLSFCQNCGKAFCSRCSLKRHIYQFNLSSLQFVCKPCSNSFNKQDAELWKEKCLSLIDEKNFTAAHGCMAMALCGDIDANQLLYSVAKRLAQQKLYESSLEFFTNSLFECTDVASVKACVAIGSTLESLADCPNTNYADRLSLLLAANSAYSCVQVKRHKCSVEIPYLDKNAESVTRKLHDTYNAEKKAYAKNATLKLDKAWAIRNCYEMMSVLLESGEDFSSHFDDYAMIGLEKFLSTKVKFANTMHNDDSAAILFFQGVLKLFKKDYSAGLIDMENAVWKGYHSEWMQKAAIDVLFIMFSDPHITTPHENLLLALKTFSVTELLADKSKCLTSLCLKPSHPVTPSARQWPDLSVTGVNTRATFKYEQAAMKLFKEDKWTAKDVALAYIDFIPSCEHPAEICACFLLAGLWFLKELETIASISKSQNQHQANFNPKVYATKRATLVCTGLAFCASQEHFHLGMQLYVARVGLQIALHAKESAQSCFTKEDGYFLSQLLNVVIRTSRFFPFWDIPIVMACEAPLLHILTGELHSEFVLSLQHIPPEKYMPFKDYELQYQLYENNLCRLCPLDNPEEAQLQAMNSMLMENGWSMEDVSYLMTSPLSPRTPEGWLIQGPELGVPMEYASIDGFVLDLKNPSLIQLLVVKADYGNVGLVSLNDLSECLQLPNSPLFFSLDPPDDDHRFHPFQAFRYEPKELQGSTILHTMFETDYLLKSFSVGTEVSSVPPFKQRPIREGLLANLPEDLQNVVKPLCERGQSQSHMQRFWIQADELVYDENINNGRLTVRFGKPKMTIRTHPLMIDTDGKSKDTSENVNPNSPEFKFAQDLTTHYDEIGKYFPMFARLQEIVKLWFIGIIIQNTLEDFRNKSRGIGLGVSATVIEEIQESERKDKLQKINQLLSQVENQYRSGRDTLYYQSSTARTKIVSNLLEMCRGQGNHVTMENKVNDWLNNHYSAEANLIAYVCGCIESASQSDFTQLRDAVSQAGYSSAGDQWVLALKQQIKQNVSSVITNLKSQYETLKANCDRQLILVKPQIVKDLTDQFKGDQYKIERLVNQWLDSSWGSSELSGYLCNCLPKISREDIEKAWQADYQRKYPLLSCLVDNLKGPNVQPELPLNFCSWVPAAILHTEKRNSFCLCYGGVLIRPKLRIIPVSVKPNSTYHLVGQKQQRPNESQKYYPPKPQPAHAAVPKPSMSKSTSARSNSNGATRFPFSRIFDNFSRNNIRLTQLELKDRLTQCLGLNPSQSSLIRHPDKPQRNVRMQNNIRARMTMINSRGKFSQMQSRGMHSQGGSSRNQRSSGGQKRNSSSTASVAAGLGAGMALGAGGGKGGGNGSDDDDDSSGGTTKYVPWLCSTWRNSKEGSYMQHVPVSSHIPYRNTAYIGTKLDGKDIWISLNPFGYKFDAWTVQKQTKDAMKLKLEFQFNANGKKEIKDNKKSKQLM